MPVNLRQYIGINLLQIYEIFASHPIADHESGIMRDATGNYTACKDTHK